MTKNIYSKTNSELDGTTETVSMEVTARHAEHLWQIVHDLDVSVTVTFYGTCSDGDTFTDGIKLGSTTLTSGGGNDFETLSDPWSKVQLELSYGSDPSSGSIDVYHNGEM